MSWISPSICSSSGVMGTSVAMAGPSLQSPTRCPLGLPGRRTLVSTGTSSRRHSRWGPADAEGCNPRTRRGTGGGDGELGLGEGEAGDGDGDGEEDDGEAVGDLGPQ